MALVSVLDELPVELLADPPSAACVLFIAEPTVPEVLPPLEELLLDVELPVVPALPPLAAMALLAVVPAAAVSFALAALFSVVLSVPAADFVLVYVSERLLLFVKSFA